MYEPPMFPMAPIERKISKKKACVYYLLWIILLILSSALINIIFWRMYHYG